MNDLHRLRVDLARAARLILECMARGMTIQEIREGVEMTIAIRKEFSK